jgi:hypothetical protein
MPLMLMLEKLFVETSVLPPFESFSPLFALTTKQ